jgi:hypothetical protein
MWAARYSLSVSEGDTVCSIIRGLA